MGIDKLSAELLGEPVLLWTIRAFADCAIVEEIIVVTSAEKRNWVEELSAKGNFSKPFIIVEGGIERHLSVWKGMEAASGGAEFLAVHDGARPLVTPEAISLCVDAAKASGAATLAHPIVDTVKRCSEAGIVIEPVEREGLWAMETPQIFAPELLRKAYRCILDRGEVVTDEVSAVQAMGVDVRVVPFDQPNLKITFPGDLSLAESILGSR